MNNAQRETKSGELTAGKAEPVLTWKVHILRENPKKLFLIVPVALASLVVFYAIFQSLLFIAIAILLFTSALSEYLFPVRYEITNQGASSRTLVNRTSIEWDRVKKYYLDDHGIKLSPLRTQSRLEAYRGVYLRFGDNKDDVVQVVRRMRDAVRAGTTAGETD